MAIARTRGPKLSDFTKGTPEWYAFAYSIMTFDPSFEYSVRRSARMILAGRDRYQSVERATGVPWYFVGCIHSMEASCSFAGVLHNGEKIIGSGRKTMLVPAGRGPFSTWESAAIDALKLRKLEQVADWSLGAMLFQAERYNGKGYLTGAGKADNSPYLWSMTSINDNTGKYVADGKYDPSTNSNGQAGVAAILKQLEIMGAIQLTQPKSAA